MKKNLNKKKPKNEMGTPGYINKNCWLAKSLNYSPYNRCQYCELRFPKCLFLHYQLISIGLIGIFLLAFYLTEGKVTTLAIVCIFTFVIVYGYVLNKSMDSVIKANFAQRKAKLALEELAGKLEERVKLQTLDIKKKAEELEVKNDNLNKLLGIKNDFLRVVNHQLNTPVSIIKSSIYMIKSGSFPLDKGLSFIEDGIKKMEEIINEFWKAFAIEGEGVKMDFKETDIVAVIEDMIKCSQEFPLVKERGLEVKLEKNIDVPKVKTDAKQIDQAVCNLIQNAISYTKAGSVKVYFENIDNNFLKIFVEDTGVGIDEEDKTKIFEKFVRGKRAINERPSGSGLGLYIAKRITEAGGGQLKLERSEVGKGTTFSMTIPIWK